MPALRKKYTLTAQIAEVRREIALRRGFYPGQVSAGKMRGGEADMHLDLMENVLETLLWLQKNESTVKAAVPKKETA